MACLLRYVICKEGIINKLSLLLILGFAVKIPSPSIGKKTCLLSSGH